MHGCALFCDPTGLTWAKVLKIYRHLQLRILRYVNGNLQPAIQPLQNQTMSQNASASLSATNWKGTCRSILQEIKFLRSQGKAFLIRRTISNQKKWDNKWWINETWDFPWLPLRRFDPLQSDPTWFNYQTVPCHGVTAGLATQAMVAPFGQNLASPKWPVPWLGPRTWR